MSPFHPLGAAQVSKVYIFRLRRAQSEIDMCLFHLIRSFEAVQVPKVHIFRLRRSEWVGTHCLERRGIHTATYPTVKVDLHFSLFPL